MTEYANLDRAGTFKAKPVFWTVRKFDSGTVSINMQFEILSQQDGEDWISWAEVSPHAAWGSFFIVKKDGTINSRTVEDLVASIGWDGDPEGVTPDKVPDCVVQITTEADVYKGETRYKVQWINQENYVHQGGGLSADELREINAVYGSRLRAVASAAKGVAPPLAKEPKPLAKEPPPAPPGFENVQPPVDEDDLPF